MMNTTMNGSVLTGHTDNPPVFTNEWVEIDGLLVSMESWQSEAERRLYREKAERLLEYHRTDEMQLAMAESELAGFQELKWEDVFDPGSALRGVSYDRDRVQSSNISDEPYQIYVAAESKLERNRREKEFLERDVQIWRQRVENGKAYLNLLRGQTRDVAELMWFDDRKMTWDAIANDLGVCVSTVKNQRSRAIETVALYLRRVEFRKVRYWFL